MNDTANVTMNTSASSEPFTKHEFETYSVNVYTTLAFTLTRCPWLNALTRHTFIMAVISLMLFMSVVVRNRALLLNLRLENTIGLQQETVPTLTNRPNMVRKTLTMSVCCRFGWNKLRNLRDTLALSPIEVRTLLACRCVCLALRTRLSIVKFLLASFIRTRNCGSLGVSCTVSRKVVVGTVFNFST